MSDARMDELEELMMESAKQIRAFFKYEGSDPRYFQKGRVAVGMIASVVRLRASETNRVAVEMAMGRSPEPKRISDRSR